MPESLAILARCEREMRKIPDKHFKLAIVDPPYGVNVTRGIGKYGRLKQKDKRQNWDTKIPSRSYFRELQRISQHQIIFGGNYFAHFLPPSRCWLIWDKGEGFYNRDFAEAELIFTSFDANTVKFRYDPLANGVYKNKIHPTQKPRALYEWMFTICVKLGILKPGDKCIDTHLGSGESRIAAYFAGFDFVGYEADPEHFIDGEANFQRGILRPPLFVPDVTETIKQLSIIL